MENLTFYRNLPGVKKQAPKAIGAEKRWKTSHFTEIYLA